MGCSEGGMCDENEINAFLQTQLTRRGLDRVAAVEAATWLEGAGLVSDSRERPGRPLRNRLRSGRIVGGRQIGKRWFIHKVSEAEPSRSAGVTTESGVPHVVRAATAAGQSLGELPGDPRGSASFRKVGFSGFVQLGEAVADRQRFLNGHDDTLRSCGVYAVFVPATWQPKWTVGEELDNVLNPWTADRLQARWVAPVELIYIGCAGRTPASRTLRKRFGDLLAHGAGRLTTNGPHKGGERLWQCAGWEQFTVAWRPSAPHPVPHGEEVAIGTAFRRLTGALPFANECL